MSVVIPSSKTMSDLLKPTGFECPKSLRRNSYYG